MHTIQRHPFRTLYVAFCIAATIVGLSAISAKAGDGVNIHGPHAQADCTKSQVRLSIHKTESITPPAAPTGFTVYTFGPVTGDDGSWHVTGTSAIAFAPADTGEWAGLPVTIPAFTGNDNCQPEVTTTTTTVPNICTEDMDCWDCTTMGNRQCGPSAGPKDGPTPISEAVPAEAPPAQAVYANPGVLGITG